MGGLYPDNDYAARGTGVRQAWRARLRKHHSQAAKGEPEIAAARGACRAPGTTGSVSENGVLEFDEALASRSNWTDDFEREGNYWNFEYVAVPRNQC